MKRKALTVLLAAALAAGSLAGCTGSNSAPEKQAGSTESTGTQAAGTQEASSEAQKGENGTPASTGKVEFWNDKLSGTEQVDLDKLAQSASEASGIDIEFISYTDVPSMRTAVEQSVNSSDAPGLFTWWSGVNLKNLVEAGAVEDLTEVWEEYIIPNGVSKDVADSLTFDGKIYAAPYSIIYNAIVYNKDLFDKYDLKEPETFEEFEKVCQTLVDNGIAPMGVDATAGSYKWFQCLVAAYDPQLYLDLCANKVKYTDERVVEVMNKWEEMQKKGFFSIPMDPKDLHKSEASGEIAMQETSDYEGVNLTDNFGGGNFDTFVMPTVSPDIKKTVFFEIAPICVAKNSADKGSALEVLKVWYGREHQTVFNEVTGFNCSSNVEISNNCAKEMSQYAMNPDEYNLMLRYYENVADLDIRNAATDQFMKFQLGGATAQEALNTIQAKADEVLGEGYAD